MSLNGLEGGHYLEPYAGGAGVALELLFHGDAAHIHINDADSAIYDFWSAITTEPEQVLKLLWDTPVDMSQWRRWRSVLRGEIKVSQVERGFATLFMNRTNRSGVLKGGVIGGLGQAGTYKLDARLKKDVLAKRIELIALHASAISVYNEDAFQLLTRCASFLPQQSLIYLDPPYYVKGQGLYRNFYEHDDHVRIAALLQSKAFNQPWLCSYDNVDEIRQMYRLSQELEYPVSYTAQVRYLGAEVMFFGPGIAVPEEEIPKPLLAA